MTTTTANQDTAPAGSLEDGRIVSIAGPVVDVEFPPHSLPEINHAVEFTIDLDGTSTLVTAEVAQQIGDGRVRCICMQQTDGLVRGASVRNLGRGITVPVGNAVLGHVFNVLGKPLDTDSIEGAAGFFTAQQRAMAAATENADELVRTLTRVMNRARQDAITTEIMEIVGGAEALRQSKGA